ncbi:hypothetical protein R3P38DRAFT_3203707 [Favolaschia claudopus]|uniref:Uncharacterized protein n=1 Tax=Favolaschia claudopus TaxID=2862362 RepID=A0AAW0ASE3_9AGAR
MKKSSPIPSALSRVCCARSTAFSDLLEARLVLARAKEQNALEKAAKSGAKKKKGSEKENQIAKPATKAAKGGKKGTVVQWSKKQYHYMTDNLLTIIKNLPRYRQALGFNKGVDGPVANKGMTLPEVHNEIAQTLLCVGEPGSEYTEDDLVDLGKVIKNRIGNLKTGYTTNREKLGETGHGLVAADKIEGKFPWYMRMHELMGTSPVVSRSAGAHSETRVDLSILDRDGEAHCGPLSIHSDDDDDTESKISGWDTSRAASPVSAAGDDVPAKAGTPVAKVKSEVKTESLSTPLSSARGIKRKYMHEQIADLTAQTHAKQLKLGEVKERGKTVRAKAKYAGKSGVEFARFEHQQHEAKLQREHELAMLERQMQLAIFQWPPHRCQTYQTPILHYSSLDN